MRVIQAALLERPDDQAMDAIKTYLDMSISTRLAGYQHDSYNQLDIVYPST